MQRITELQRQGLWSERRLPKVQEPTRSRVHWDFLLEEMIWLSADFAQERKWKKSAAKKCARMVQKYFQEKAIQAQKAEKLEELRLKKIAGFLAKEIKVFWANVEKVIKIFCLMKDRIFYVPHTISRHFKLINVRSVCSLWEHELFNKQMQLIHLY